MKEITIVGLGAIGTKTVTLLADKNIKLKLIDRDIIEEKNLQRQQLFTKENLGKEKATVAKEKLSKFNKNITAHVVNINSTNISIIKSDLILDCTDNLKTRFLINDFAIKYNIPWIYSAAVKDRCSLLNIIPNKTMVQLGF